MWINLQKLGQSKITVLELKSRFERLEDYWRQFQSTHFQLLAFDELVTHEYHTKDIFTMTEENYFHVRNKFLAALGTTSLKEQKLEPANPSAPLIQQMQLPKIDLPKFSGDLLYKAMTVTERNEQVKKLGACLNCLRVGHHADACPTTGRCLVCAGKHHTTIHGAQYRSPRTIRKQ